MKNIVKTNETVIETLEGRTMMSGTALGISEVAVGNGVELQIQGVGAKEHITLTQTSAGLVVGNNGWSQTVAGQFQDIKVMAGANGTQSVVVDASVETPCSIYGGTNARSYLQAGSGDDILVSINSKASTLVGGAGNDSFWTNAKVANKLENVTAAEVAAGNVHKVGAFYTGPAPIKNAKAAAAAKKLAAAGAIEPATTNGATYENFSSQPLFGAAGPSENDIIQGQIGDCYFLSVLSSVAKIDPAKIEQSIVQMNDGTYLVQFAKGNTTVYVHVDAQLPVLSNGQLDYAGLGADGSIWVAVMEKAFTVLQGGTNANYASINGGWMDESYAALGDASTSFYGGTGAASLMSMIAAAVAAGQSVTFGTIRVADGAPLIADHAYTVDAVVYNNQGAAVGLRLRNPWGIDGAGNDGSNDGYVTLTAQQAYDSLAGIVIANV